MGRACPKLPVAATVAIACLAGGLIASGAADAAGHAERHRRAAENLPPRGKAFFGVTDTGEAAGFEDFANAVGAHPAVIETYHPYGNSVHISFPAGSRSTPARCCTSPPPQERTATR